MSTKRKTTKASEAAAAAMPPIPKELVDRFVSGPMSAEAILPGLRRTLRRPCAPHALGE